MSPKSRRRISTGIAGLSISLSAAAASAQISGLNKGQRWFLKNGIQLQGMASTGDPFHLATYQGMNYTAVNWIWTSDVSQLGPAPGSFPWARWVAPGASPPGTADMPPIGAEGPYLGSLIALSLGDEPNLIDNGVRDTYVNWFNSVAPSYPNQLLYMNNWGGQIPDGPLSDFIVRAHPDMISFDTYPYRYAAPNNPVPVQPAGGSPTNWYGDLRRYRQWGIDLNTPVGMYRQTYHSTTEGVRDVSESELRLMTYAGLAFNAKYFTDFTYNTGASSFFDKTFGGDNMPTALYAQAAQINSEVRKLGPAMVRLKPVNDATTPNWTSSIMIVRGKNDPGSGAVYNPAPVGFIPDGASQAYTDWTFGVNDPYLSGGFPSGATNIGTKNGGLPGDVIVSWFTPGDEWFDGDDWTNEKYIMVVNGLADMNGSAADTRQTITLDFSMGASGITMLQKINRSTGAVEDVPMTLVGGKRRLVLTLDGGTGELFKFKDGAPFVGTLPNDAIWTSAASGAFETGGNWDIAAAPGATNFVHFGATTSGSGPSYSVTLASNASVKGVFVHRDNVTMNLNGKTLSASGFAGVDSLIVGMRSGESGSLTINNGSLSVAANPGNFAQIGKAAGATGVVTVGSGGNFVSAADLLVGKSGVGTLNVNANASGTFPNVTLGGSTGVSAGILNVNGGSVNITGTLRLNDTGGAAPAGTRVNLASGLLAVGSLVTSNNPARFNWTGGTFAITGSNLNVSPSGVLGANLAISGTKNLNVNATLSVNSSGAITQTGGGISAGTISLTTGSSFTRIGGMLAFANLFQTGGTSWLGSVNGAGAITVGGGAAATQMTLDNVVQNSLTINNLGTVIVSPGNGATASKVNTLSIAGGATPTGTLNLNDNAIAINYSGASPIAVIASQILAGYAGGAWTGPGINSAVAAAVASDAGNTNKTALGYAEASSVFASFPAIFQNQSIDSTTLLIRYTFLGDADLNGAVDSIDFNLLAANFSQAGKRWSDGDFNFDGMVDSIDFNQMASNFGQTLPAQVVRAGEVGSLIPEPGSLGIAFSAGLLLRRRRRTRECPAS